MHRTTVLFYQPWASTFADGPSFTCGQHYEIKADAQVQSVCEAEGVPLPTIIWTKDGKTIPTPTRWTKDDSGTYSLLATNDHGTDSHVLYLDVLCTLAGPTYKNPVCFLPSSSMLFTDGPVFDLGNYSQEFRPGENVTLECSAEGNPPPDVYWEYSPAVNALITTGGRQKSIRIPGATSTNAGVYICVAKSKAGRSARSVSLLMKGATIVRPH